MSSLPIQLVLEVVDADPGHVAATTVASVCRRTRRAVEARVRVTDGELPESFRAGNLTVEFYRSLDLAIAASNRSAGELSTGAPMGAMDGAGWDRCWWLEAGELAVGDLASPATDEECRVGSAAASGWKVSAGDCGGAGRTELEWGRSLPTWVSWVGGAKPWDTPAVPGAQLWLRELTDWESLKYELALRERDHGKPPAWVVHLARLGARNADLLEKLEDAGFAIEMVRGCDPEYPADFSPSVGLLLEWFGWRPDRAGMARALSHRWAWQMFLQQSDAPAALVCEDDCQWTGMEATLRELGASLGNGPWVVDLAASLTDTGLRTNGLREVPPDGGPLGPCYWLSREAARRLLELDCCNARALVEPKSPLDGLRRLAVTPGRDLTREIPALQEGSVRLIDRSKPRLLIGICSCQRFAAKRQAVRDAWFPRGLPTVEARFFVGTDDACAALAESDTVTLAVPDDYEHLPLKVVEFFRHALETHDFDYLFKCDDDTYLVPERLLELADGRADYVGNEFILNRGAADGGAGYLLSRAIVERIVADTSLAPTGNEDIIIGEAAIRHGAVAAVDRRLVWDTSRIPRWNNDGISCHRMSPPQLAAAAALIRLPWTVVDCHQASRNEQLLLHEGGYFSLKSAGIEGRWNWDSNTRWLTLAGDDGTVEVLEIGARNQVIQIVGSRSDLPAGLRD